MGRARAESYATAVMKILSAEFSELASPDTASAVSAAVDRHATHPSASFEVILDSASANWRLQADRATAGKVRLACFRPTPSAADHDREQRINDTLGLIGR